MTSENGFARDVQRSMILGAFMKHWGTPELRRATAKASDVVELYSFPARAETDVCRCATIGVSSIMREDGRQANFELLMVLPRDLGRTTFEEVSLFMFDVFTYSLRHDVTFSVGKTIPPTPLMPKAWPPRAVLLDEPRGEDPELAQFHIGGRHISLLWIVPIYASEYNFIRRHGIGAFYDLEATSDTSWADPSRPPLVTAEEAV